MRVNKIRDMIKDIYCLKNGWNFVRIPYSVKLTKELVSDIFEWCARANAKGKLLYITYEDYFDNTMKHVSMDKIEWAVIWP